MIKSLIHKGPVLPNEYEYQNLIEGLSPLAEEMLVNYVNKLDNAKDESINAKLGMYKAYSELASLENSIDDIEEYKIVGTIESDPDRGWISNESPIGKALLNKKKGETVLINTPNGSYSVKIVSIK